MPGETASRPLPLLAADSLARQGAPTKAPPTQHPRQTGDEVDTSARKLDTSGSKLDTFTRKLNTSAAKLNTLGAKLNTFARKLNTSLGSGEQVSTLVAVHAPRDTPFRRPRNRTPAHAQPCHLFSIGIQSLIPPPRATFHAPRHLPCRSAGSPRPVSHVPRCASRRIPAFAGPGGVPASALRRPLPDAPHPHRRRLLPRLEERPAPSSAAGVR